MIQFCYVENYDYTPARVCKPPASNLPTQTRSSISSALTLSCIMNHIEKKATYENDEKRDTMLGVLEIDAVMYTLADNNGISKLRRRILDSLVERPIIAEVPVGVCSNTFRHSMIRDYDLKWAMAMRVAKCYSKLRENHSAWLENWVKADPTFGLMMMDRFEGVNRPLETVKRMDDQDWILEWDKRPLSYPKPPSTSSFSISSSLSKDPIVRNDASTQAEPRVADPSFSGNRNQI